MKQSGRLTFCHLALPEFVLSLAWLTSITAGHGVSDHECNHVEGVYCAFRFVVCSQSTTGPRLCSRASIGIFLGRSITQYTQLVEPITIIRTEMVHAARCTFVTQYNTLY